MGVSRKQSTPKFPKNKHFLPPDTQIVQLKAMGILSAVTFRTNRLKGCPIASDKELKNEGRGSYDYCSDVNSGVHVIK